MTLHECLAALEGAGTGQNRKIYARHGVCSPMFGVSYAFLGTLKKRIKTDDALAVELWETGNHDARVLATMIAASESATVARLNQWARECADPPLMSGLASYIARTELAIGRAKVWLKSKQEGMNSIGWTVVSSVATGMDFQTPDPIADAYFAELIPRIESTISDSPNLSRSCMHLALIAIGGRSESLKTLAIGAAKRIGLVTIDHGETGCKTPDAVEYIEKIWAYRQKTGRPARRRC